MSMSVGATSRTTTSNTIAPTMAREGLNQRDDRNDSKLNFSSMGLLRNRQDLQDFSGLISILKILKNPVNPVYFHSFRVSQRDMLNSCGKPRVVTTLYRIRQALALSRSRISDSNDSVGVGSGADSSFGVSFRNRL